jgi:CRP/FNR family transcriptional regulator
MKDLREFPVNISKNSLRTGGPVTTPRCDHCSTRGRCLLAVLPSPQHEHFRSLVRERSVAVGETVEKQGAHGQVLGVVKVGLLKGLRRGPGGDGKTIMLAGKGRLIGFTQPFGQPALLSLLAITPTRICELPVQAVNDMAMPQSQFQQALYRITADFLGCMADWSRLLREDSYLAKVCAALHLIAAEEGHHAFRIPSHTELASVLGTRRETVARHIAILIERGLLRKVDRWHGVLITPDCSLVWER